MPSDWLRSGQRREEEAWSLEERRKGGNGIRRSDAEEDEEVVAAVSSGETKENTVLSEAERRGRTTGSVEWRAARGELGQGDARVRALCTTDAPEEEVEEEVAEVREVAAVTMQERVRVVFQRLVDEGKTPNEAAAMALTIVRAEQSGSKK